MRNFLLVLTTVVFTAFVLIILPASISGKNIISTENQIRGRVLGATEAMADEHLENFFNNYSLPKNPDTKKEEKKLYVPYKKESYEDVSVGEVIAFLLDEASDKVLFEQDSEREVPVASITKLMTALTFLDTNPEWDSYVKIEGKDIVGGAQIYILSSEEIKIKDLFHLSLIASANSATKSLVSSTGLSESEFVELMNNKAIALGLKKTKFVDPIGFGINNISCAREVAQILKVALQEEYIKEITQKDSYSFITKNGRSVRVNATDKLLSSYPKNGIEMQGGKTGFTSQAGYCFTGGFESNEGHKLISVVLNGATYNSRFSYTDKLITWAFENFEWK